MNTDENQINALTEQIIGCAFKVANTLGCGFLEKVYENALAYELTKAGLRVEKQVAIEVRYEGIVVGEYLADLIVYGFVPVLIELKAAKGLDVIHSAQCMNYLKATGYCICLLINFGTPRIEVKRIMN